jgi:FkbM family methyltransferase
LIPFRSAFRRNPTARLLWARYKGSGSSLAWWQLLKPGMTVLDLGANVGYYTFLASYKVGVTGRVYAVEPFPAAFQQLEAEVAWFRHKNVVLHQVAASDNPGSHAMYVDRGHNPSNSLHPVPGLLADPTAIVRSVRIDDLVGRRQMDIIKVDVEGHELHALRGTERLISHNPAIQLFVEFNPATLIAADVKPATLVGYLHSFGFRLYPVIERTGELGRAAANSMELGAIATDQGGSLNMVARRA